MKPLSIALSINLAFFAIWALFFLVVVNRPELIPLMTSVQAAFNGLFSAGFFVDKKREIGMAFLWMLLLSVAVTLAGYYFIVKLGGQVGVEEGFTAQLAAWVGAMRA